jgi:hypothetical protein
MGVAYPIGITAVISSLSFLLYACTGRIAMIPCAIFALGITFPLCAAFATQVGRYVRDYAHLYRGKRDIREWLEFKRKNPYRFTDSGFDRREESSTFQRERTQDAR